MNYEFLITHNLFSTLPDKKFDIKKERLILVLTTAKNSLSMNKLFDTKIEKILNGIQIVENLARKKFVSAFILSLIKIKKVQFSELAYSLNDSVKVESNERRIQHFFEKVDIDFDQIALLLCLFLPQGKVKLCLDRTEWDFGKTQVNILAVTAYCRGVGIPIYFELLDNKSGNSSTQDRNNLLEKCIALLGINRIECVIGDREFIGEKFYKYMFINKLKFYLRIRKNQYFIVNGIELRAEDLLKNRNSCRIDNVKFADYYLSVGIKKVKDKNGNDDFLIVITNTFAHQALKIYKFRWSIEVFFQSIKTRGFQLEDSHLTVLERIKKLFAFVAIAFALCLSAGIDNHEKVQKIKNKNHNYKAKSFFRNGLDMIRNLFRKSEQQLFYEFDNLIIKFIRLIRIQLTRYQLFIKIVG
jgi:hypothetical protein